MRLEDGRQESLSRTGDGYQPQKGQLRRCRPTALRCFQWVTQRENMQAGVGEGRGLEFGRGEIDDDDHLVLLW